jgi:hypothetical protein
MSKEVLNRPLIPKYESIVPLVFAPSFVYSRRDHIIPGDEYLQFSITHNGDRFRIARKTPFSH